MNLPQMPQIPTKYLALIGLVLFGLGFGTSRIFTPVKIKEVVIHKEQDTNIQDYAKAADLQALTKIIASLINKKDIQKDVNKTREVTHLPDGTITEKETETSHLADKSTSESHNETTVDFKAILAEQLHLFQESLKMDVQVTEKEYNTLTNYAIGFSVNFKTDLSRDFKAEGSMRLFRGLWGTISGSYPSKTLGLGGRIEF